MSRQIFVPSTLSDLTTAIKNRAVASSGVTVWDRLVGGNRLTDLYTVATGDITGNPIPNGVLNATVSGQLTSFMGPDEISTVYLEYRGGTARQPVTASRLSTQGDASAFASASRLGVSLSGLEFSATQAGGTEGVDYFRVQEADVAYFHSHGVDLIRIPFNWERLQPTLNAALDTTYLGYITEAVGYCSSRGMKATLDLHMPSGGMRYVGGVQYAVGSAQVPITALADLWFRLAKVFVAYPAVDEYEIMNEPGNLSVRNTTPTGPFGNTLTSANQACINAIRLVDTTKWIGIATEGYQDASTFATYYGSNPVPWWQDPAGRVRVHVHYYLDVAHVGAYTSAWTTTCRTRISSELTPVLSWGQSRGIPIVIGEVGVPNRFASGQNVGDIANWLTDFDTVLTLADTYGAVVFQWGAGAHYNSITSTEPVTTPGGLTTDYSLVTDQLAVFLNHLGLRSIALAGGASTTPAASRAVTQTREQNIRILRPADDPAATTLGSLIRPEAIYGFDTEWLLPRRLSFRDLADTTETARLFAEDGTSFLPAIRIASATGPEWYAEAQTRIGARSGANLSLPAEILARAYFRTGVSVSPSAGVVTLNCSSGSLFYVNMNANVTSWAFSNNPNIDGAEFEVHFIQDGTGSRTLAGANGLIRFPGGTAPTLTTTAGKRDIFKFTYASGGTFCQNSAAAMAVNAG